MWGYLSRCFRSSATSFNVSWCFCVSSSICVLLNTPLSDARHPVFVVALTATAAGLLPLFRYLWLRVVTGNANFYYASTLLWTFSNGLVLTELLYAEARRVFVDRTAHEKIDVSKYDIRQV